MPMHIRRPVLLVVDMQEFFRSFAKDVVPQVNDMIKFARDENIPIIYTLHGHPDPERDEDRNVMVSYLGKDNVIKCAMLALEKDSLDYQLMPEVDLDTKNDLLIEKEVYSSFNGKPSLEKIVRDKGYDGLFITGVCTNLCDETTSRDGVCRNIPIVLIKDAVSTYTKEMHNASLLNIEFGFGPVLTHDEVKTRWQEKKHIEVRQEKGVLPSKPSSGTDKGSWRWWPFGGQ